MGSSFLTFEEYVIEHNLQMLISHKKNSLDAVYNQTVNQPMPYPVFTHLLSETSTQAPSYYLLVHDIELKKRTDQADE